MSWGTKHPWSRIFGELEDRLETRNCFCFILNIICSWIESAYLSSYFVHITMRETVYQIDTTEYLVGTVNNAIKSGGRKWKHKFDHDLRQNLHRTMESYQIVFFFNLWMINGVLILSKWATYFNEFNRGYLHFIYTYRLYYVTIHL